MMMEKVSRHEIDDFLAQRKLALVGVSRRAGKFGNMIYKELSAKGYQVFPVHPEAKENNGMHCWPSLQSLPERVGGLIIVVRPEQTEKVVRDAVAAGIERVWMQQGSQSDEAISFCRENGVSVIHNECILMFAEPAGWIHRFHRGILKLLGKAPQ